MKQLSNFISITVGKHLGKKRGMHDAKKLPSLQDAAMLGAVGYMQAVLACGVDVNTHDDAGKTALDYAIQYRQLEATQFLLSAYFQRTTEYLNIKSIIESLLALQLQTVLSKQEAVSIIDKIVISLDYTQKSWLDQQREIVNIIHLMSVLVLQKIDMPHEVVNVDGVTFLHLVALIGDIDLIQAFLDKGIIANCSGENCKTPLYYAIQSDQLEAVECLSQSSLNIDLSNEEAISLIDAIVILIREIQNEDIRYSSVCEIISLVGQFVLQKTKDIRKVVNSEGISFLHLAAFIGDIDLIQDLLTQGSEVNHCDLKGKTALCYAIQNTQLKAVERLLQAPLKKSLTQEEATTLINTMIIVLNEMRNSFEVEQTVPVIIRVVGMFILKQVDNIEKLANAKGMTYLHLAALIGDIDLIGGFLKKGMKINCQNFSGKTPLYYAIQNDQWDTVNFLLAQQNKTGGIDDTSIVLLSPLLKY